MDCVIAAGVEMMGRVAMGSDWLWATNKDPQAAADYAKGLPMKILHQV